MTTILVAHDEGRVIGNKGVIPWHIPADLKRFKKTTLFGAVIMGRKTFESLPNGALPMRVNIVISKTMPEQAGLVVARSPQDAIELATGHEPFVIGGEQIYRRFLYLGLVDKVIATEVYGKHEGDTVFPKLFEHEGWSSEVVEEQDTYRIVEWLQTHALRAERDHFKKRVELLRKKLRKAQKLSDDCKQVAQRYYRASCDFIPPPEED